MKYKKLGKLDIFVSEIGLGCEGFNGKTYEESKEMIDLALNNGINCIDLYTPNPIIHKNIGKSIGNKRSDFIYQAHLCTKWENGSYVVTRNLEEVKASFNRLLLNLGTNYVDVGMIHYVDSLSTWNEIVNNGILEYSKELKKNGIIKGIGISSHHPDVALKIIEEGFIDVLMFSVNPCYDLLPGDEDCDILFNKDTYNKDFINFDETRVKLYEECEKREVAITVMKAYGGGELLSESSPTKIALTVNECIHYALTRPGVKTVFVGAKSINELQDAIDYESAKDEDKDFTKKFIEFPRINWEGYCMYCGHCAPCSNKIDIAMVTKLLNLAIAAEEVIETVREHYNSLEKKASDCIECGICLDRCPFHVDIIANMKNAKKTFGN